MPDIVHIPRMSDSSSASRAQLASRLALPFQQSSEIDVTRLRKILGVAEQTARRMMRAGIFRAYDGPSGWRIDYISVVEYCERLSSHYRISGLNAPRPASGRIRDRDLLPFPLDQTVYISDVRDRLRCSIGAVIKLIEEGKLIAYQSQIDSHGCPWRIHAPSLLCYTDSLRAQAIQRHGLRDRKRERSEMCQRERKATDAKH